MVVGLGINRQSIDENENYLRAFQSDLGWDALILMKGTTVVAPQLIMTVVK
jgi:hypothetical protein